MRVVVTDRKYPELADPYGDVVRSRGGEIAYHEFESEREVIDGAAGADALVISKAPITERVLDALSDLQFVLRVGTGFDTVDVRAATARGVAVSNVPGLYCSEELAEHAVGLMLAAAREVVYLDRAMREADGWGPGKMRPVHPTVGGTFGVYGLGHIGRAAARLAGDLGMDVIAYDPYLPADLFSVLEVESVGFETLLERSDCVSVHAPLTAETHHRFSTAEFERMRDTAVLVNTARGPIVDEAALVAAIEAGEILGAGLDVFETEPPTGTPALDCDHIVCSPHHGGSTDESKARCVEFVRSELERFVADEHLRNVVNPDVFKYDGELRHPERDEWTD